MKAEDQSEVELVEQARSAFSCASPPGMTLREGDARDSYATLPPVDQRLDQVCDEYLERYFWGCNHLDPDSWKHYLPSLIDYSLRHLSHGGSLVVGALLSTLRPSSADDPKISSLSPPQEVIICQFLDRLAFADGSAFQRDAQQVMEEFWVNHSIYRPNKVFA